MTASPNPADPKAVAHGGVEEFNRHWETSRTRTNKDLNYTPGAPGTVLQMYHKGYVHDLWQLMGDRAKTGKYLELGCGRGTTSMYLAERGCDVTMLDLAPVALQLAEECFQLVNIPCPKLVLGSAEATGLPGDSYDCVYNIGLLEHFADPTAVLRESMRVLRSGGLLFNVIVPEIPPRNRLLSQALFCPWRIPRTLRNQYLYRRQFNEQGRTGREVMRTAFAREQYAEWLRKAGAIDVRCLPYNPYHEYNRRNGLLRAVQLAAYRAYFGFARAIRSAPVLRTTSWTAQCDLLLGRKP